METGSWQQQQVALVMVLMLIQIAEQRPVRARDWRSGAGMQNSVQRKSRPQHSTVASQSTAVKLQYFRVVEQRKNYKLMCSMNSIIAFREGVNNKNKVKKTYRCVVSKH